MDEHTKQLLLLGREHYQKREFDKAEQMLRQVLDTDDRLADVHDMLGVICHTRGNFAQAEHHFERALAINPSYTEAALNLAVTYNDRGKYEAARQVYARIKGQPGGNARGARPVRARQDREHARRGGAGLRGRGPRRARPSPSTRRPSRLCPQFADLRTKLGTLLREMNDLPRRPRAVRGRGRRPGRATCPRASSSA